MLDIDEFRDYISKRITHLRMEKGASARDMSLTIGQGAGYINTIENKKAIPSMNMFFYICEYFNISPKDFFDAESAAPGMVNDTINIMKKLSPEQLSSIASIVRDLTK